MNEPINPDRPIFDVKYPSGVCLAASFADKAAHFFNDKVGLIPCADGGTRIEQWMPGGLLYDHAVMMAKLAMRTSVLSGILWHQGESDCSSDEDMLAHKEKFITMITALRAELGAEQLPLVIGELSELYANSERFGDRPHRMNERYHEIAKELPCSGIASSEGLSLKPDGLHFNSASLREFGNRYFDVWRTLYDRQ